MNKLGVLEAYDNILGEWYKAEQENGNDPVDKALDMRQGFLDELNSPVDYIQRYYER